MTLTSILPRELVALVIEFYARDDSDSALLRQVSKTLMDMSPRPKNRKGYRLRPSRFVSRFPMLQWAIDNKYTGHRVALYAARMGNREILQWLRGKGYQPTKFLFNKAVASGNLELVKWLRESGCPSGGGACNIAARYGYLEILKWLRIFDDSPWSEYTCETAARGGHLDVLKWLKKNGCPWDFYTPLMAASCGHLRILKWAISKGCPWNPRHCSDHAYWNNHHHIVRWIQRLAERMSRSTR